MINLSLQGKRANNFNFKYFIFKIKQKSMNEIVFYVFGLK